MGGRLQVDTELLGRAGTTLTTIGEDLRTVTATAGLRGVLGDDALADAVDRFAHGWDDARAGLLRVVGDLGDACREVATTFDGIDDELASRLREAFA